MTVMISRTKTILIFFIFTMLLSACSGSNADSVSQPQPSASAVQEDVAAETGQEKPMEIMVDAYEDVPEETDAQVSLDVPGEDTAAEKKEKKEFKIFYDEKKIKKLAKVKKGWTKTKILKLAGEPSSIKGEVWYYYWQEPGLGCVRYKYYNFTFEDDKVIKIDSGAGHETLEPY